MVVTETSVGDIAAVRRAVDQLLEGSLEPLLDLLADDVELEVTGGGRTPSRSAASGKAPVKDYFTALGGLMAFWRVDYTATEQQVIAWGKEAFTLKHSGLEGACEFALVMEFADGRIARLRVIEELRTGGRAVRRAGGQAGGRTGGGERAVALI